MVGDETFFLSMMEREMAKKMVVRDLYHLLQIMLLPAVFVSLGSFGGVS